MACSRHCPIHCHIDRTVPTYDDYGSVVWASVLLCLTYVCTDSVCTASSESSAWQSCWGSWRPCSDWLLRQYGICPKRDQLVCKLTAKPTSLTPATFGSTAAASLAAARTHRDNDSGAMRMCTCASDLQEPRCQLQGRICSSTPRCNVP